MTSTDFNREQVENMEEEDNDFFKFSLGIETREPQILKKLSNEVPFSVFNKGTEIREEQL